MGGQAFDPYVGFLHSLEYGRLSLACDLVEPLRSAFCDRIGVKLFNQHRMHFQEDFEERDGGVYMKRTSIPTLLKIYNSELNKDRNYGFFQGSFEELLIYFADWLRGCITDKTVRRLVDERE